MNEERIERGPGRVTRVVQLPLAVEVHRMLKEMAIRKAGFEERISMSSVVEDLVRENYATYRKAFVGAGVSAPVVAASVPKTAEQQLADMFEHYKKSKRLPKGVKTPAEFQEWLKVKSLGGPR